MAAPLFFQIAGQALVGAMRASRVSGNMGGNKAGSVSGRPQA
jgi:hypothetical protein